MNMVKSAYTSRTSCFSASCLFSSFMLRGLGCLLFCGTKAQNVHSPNLLAAVSGGCSVSLGELGGKQSKAAKNSWHCFGCRMLWLSVVPHVSLQILAN